MNIITYKLEKNTISDGNMEGDLLFILHKLTIGKNYKFRKKKKCQKSMEDAVFLCNLTGGINTKRTVCVKLHCFMGRTFVFCVFLGIVKLLYKVALFYSLDIQNAHKDKMCPTLHRKKVLVFCVGCGKIISGFEV